MFTLSGSVTVTVLTSPCDVFSPVFVLLWNTAIGSFPPGRARATLFSLLPPTAARRTVRLAGWLLALLGLALLLGGQRPLGTFWVGA